jgi:branched-chain amino acid transport system substrate-binding protein
MTRSRSVATRSIATLVISVAATAPARSEELRIGLIAPLTGMFSQVGKDMVNGFQMYLDAHKGKGAFGGATIKFVVEDSQGKADAAVAKARKLVSKDKVHMLVGGGVASTGYALAPVSTSEKTVYIASVPTADDLTQRRASEYPWLIRTGWSSSQPAHPMGQWACDHGYTRIATIAVDTAFGYEQVGGFQKAFEDCAGQIIQKIWLPLGSKKFGPYIDAIAEEVDAVFSVMAGRMARHFPREFHRARKKTPIIGGGTSYDEFALPLMGREVIGDVSSLQYSAALETPKNKAFVRGYRKKYYKVPSSFSESNYTTAQLIDQVMRQTGGTWPGAGKFVTMMAALKVDAVRGPLSFDEMRNPVQNVYIKQVERKRMFGYRKRELWNSVVTTYPAVSQFWTYSKNEFLKQPVYSRDYPPCKYCELAPTSE